MTIEELCERQQKELERQASLRRRIACCTAAGCMSCGADSVRRAVKAEIEARGLANEVEVCGTGCMGLCSRGVLVRTSDDGSLWGQVTAADAAALVSEQPAASAELAARRIDTNAAFFTRQLRIVLANSGVADPERLDDYIATGGYQALAKALSEMTPEEVIAEVRRSGLRGRGGAGYPTALKWELVAKQKSTPKYVICNADEGDPGAFMDRSVLEGDPHRVLEGMAIAGYAVGAQQGFIYVRGEYTLAIQRLQTAIRQAEREQLLGNRIFGDNFQFRIDLRIGAGAFVCGEETALIASIEGKRGQPRQRPPYPPESGLWGQPTLINNVETFANIAPIIRNGGDWFARIGTPTSTGTKVFALAGKIANTGLIEVPMGISLREIVFDIGGGVPGGRFKAAQTGGPSGGCIPAEYLDTPVDYESLAAIGSIMGSGGLIIMDDQSSMVDVARFFMEFCMEESCGKCIPCRAGTVQMHDILSRLLRGEATRLDLEMLERLATLLKETSLCGLGITAPNPVISTLKYFRHEYEALLAGAAQEKCHERQDADH
ncbi:MAG: NADH-quinone oxidoreductase subunit NuoF [Bryobacteraceae bacterium]|nr:NADH-quinone oxidoreductase subunit NuoF [Bryobacteraceae bacterium]MCX7604540.1 NADH-quinone oxidoreductase subunit NuoF [Bryobacteraceae bacterium]